VVLSSARYHRDLLAGGALLLAAVGAIYSAAAGSYFFNDDFHWLQGAAQFEAANLLRLDRYDHFYRPVIEIYFFVGRGIFGCAAFPFHLASIAIHLANTLLLFLFARALAQSDSFGFLTALFFCVQPGFVEAVAWVAAITDLLPAFWYLATLYGHLLFLRRREVRFYLLSLAAFLACLLTHESSATLLPMMLALEVTLAVQAGASAAGVLTKRAVFRYAPFAVLLVGSLAIAYVVNSRSYLVREGFYRFGWHAVAHMFQYIVALSVWKRGALPYAVIASAIAALVVRGTPRLRFFVLWMVVTLAPASFFTWGIASRYLYVPAAGFALVLADLTLACQAAAMRTFSPRVVRVATIVVAAGLSVRFAVFAQEAARDFRERTRPYERLVAALRPSNPTAGSNLVVHLDRLEAEAVPALYLEPAVQTAYCSTDVQLVVD
jgi:hypothetical protein